VSGGLTPVCHRQYDDYDEAKRTEDDAFAAIRRFVHAAAEPRMGAVILVLLEGLVVDEELVRIRTRTATTVEGLIRAAHERGGLRPEVGAGDLILLSIRLSRPLPDGLARLDPNSELLHRHLDLALDGLTTRAATTPTAGRPLSFTDLLTAASPEHRRLNRPAAPSVEPTHRAANPPVD
jgi:hypothetical protein